MFSEFPNIPSQFLEFFPVYSIMWGKNPFPWVYLVISKYLLNKIPFSNVLRCSLYCKFPSELGSVFSTYLSVSIPIPYFLLTLFFRVFMATIVCFLYQMNLKSIYTLLYWVCVNIVNLTQGKLTFSQGKIFYLCKWHFLLFVKIYFCVFQEYFVFLFLSYGFWIFFKYLNYVFSIHH